MLASCRCECCLRAEKSKWFSFLGHLKKEDKTQENLLKRAETKNKIFETFIQKMCECHGGNNYPCGFCEILIYAERLCVESIREEK